MKLYIDEKDSALGGLRQVRRTTPNGYRYLPLEVPLFKFKNKRIRFIINRWIVKRPLKPSIKFAPFIIKRKHNVKKIIETGKCDLYHKSNNLITPTLLDSYKDGDIFGEFSIMNAIGNL